MRQINILNINETNKSILVNDNQSGTISNVHLKVTITQDNVAGFANTFTGDLSECSIIPATDNDYIIYDASESAGFVKTLYGHMNRCYAIGDIYGSESCAMIESMIVPTGSHYNIKECYFKGALENNFSSFNTGIVYYTEGTVLFEECYVVIENDYPYSVGIVAYYSLSGLGDTSDMEIIAFKNCYVYGGIMCGFMGPQNEIVTSLEGLNIYIEDCYAIGDFGLILSLEGDDWIINISNCVCADVLIGNNSDIVIIESNNIININIIKGSILSAWNINVWIAGSNEDYPMLRAFLNIDTSSGDAYETDIWSGYINSVSSPELISNMHAPWGELNGGGDPHIKMLDGTVYTYPHEIGYLTLLKGISDGVDFEISCSARKLTLQERTGVKNVHGNIIKPNTKWLKDFSFFDNVTIKVNNDEYVTFNCIDPKIIDMHVNKLITINNSTNDILGVCAINLDKYYKKSKYFYCKIINIPGLTIVIKSDKTTADINQVSISLDREKYMYHDLEGAMIKQVF